MAIDRCMGCMEPLGADAESACPCGYDPSAPLETALELPPGTTLGDEFVLGRVIGRGGFGLTYIGWQKGIGRKVAIKEFLPTSLVTRVQGEPRVIAAAEANAELFAARLHDFQEEGQKLARFHGHPNIVDVFQFVEANGTGYLVMELLTGSDLLSFLESNGGKVPFRLAHRILSPVAQALRALHAENIFHRDISPDNIFMVSDGRRVKLLDLGSARFFSGDRAQTTTAILKTGYAPPEQYTTRGIQGAWTDIYSLGATYYRSLTGRTPPQSLDLQIGNEELESFESLGVLVPEPAAAAIFRAMQLPRDKRFQKVEDFQQELDRGLAALSADAPATKAVPEPSPQSPPPPQSRLVPHRRPVVRPPTASGPDAPPSPVSQLSPNRPWTAPASAAGRFLRTLRRPDEASEANPPATRLPGAGHPEHPAGAEPPAHPAFPLSEEDDSTQSWVIAARAAGALLAVAVVLFLFLRGSSDPGPSPSPSSEAPSAVSSGTQEGSAQAQASETAAPESAVAAQAPPAPGTSIDIAKQVALDRQAEEYRARLERERRERAQRRAEEERRAAQAAVERELQAAEQAREQERRQAAEQAQRAEQARQEQARRLAAEREAERERQEAERARQAALQPSPSVRPVLPRARPAQRPRPVTIRREPTAPRREPTAPVTATLNPSSRRSIAARQRPPIEVPQDTPRGTVPTPRASLLPPRTQAEEEEEREQPLVTRASSGCADGVPEACQDLSNIYRERGNFSAAVRFMRQALDLNEKVRNREGIAANSSALGTLYYAIGDLDEAEKNHERSLRITSTLGDRLALATDYSNLGLVYQGRGDLNRAEESQRKSLELHEALGDKAGKAANLTNLGLIQQTRGEVGLAEDLQRQALALNMELGFRAEMAANYGNIGGLLQLQGRIDEAEEFHLEALAINQELGRRAELAANYGNLGGIYRARGQLSEAEEAVSQSLALNQELGLKPATAVAYGSLGLIYEARNQLERAEQAHRQALAIHEEIGNASGSATNYANLGNVFATGGRTAEARQAWERARDLFRQVGAPDRVSLVEGWLSELD